jgi:hypothetical protein
MSYCGRGLPSPRQSPVRAARRSLALPPRSESFTVVGRDCERRSPPLGEPFRTEGRASGANRLGPRKGATVRSSLPEKPRHYGETRRCPISKTRRELVEVARASRSPALPTCCRRGARPTVARDAGPWRGLPRGRADLAHVLSAGRMIVKKKPLRDVRPLPRNSLPAGEPDSDSPRGREGAP